MEDWGFIAGISYAVVGLIAITLGGLILGGAPHIPRNHWLAALLIVMGLHAILFGLYDMQQWGLEWSPTPAQSGMYTTAWVLFTLTPLVYMGLIRNTMQHRQWWNRPITVVIMGILTVAFIGYVLMYHIQWVAQDIGRSFGIYAGGLVGLIGFFVSLWWFVHAMATREERRVAFAFLLAFTVRNLQFAKDTVIAVSRDYFDNAVYIGPSAWYTEWNFSTWQNVVLEGGFILLMTFAVLSGQIVAMDNRIRTTIRTGSVSVFLAATFLLISEGTEIFLGVESAALSLAAAAIIALLIQPAQRAAEVIATRMVPGASFFENIPKKERKQIFLLQTKLALADGHIGNKEQQMLDQLQDQLHLRDNTVEKIHVKARKVIAKEQRKKRGK